MMNFSHQEAHDFGLKFVMDLIRTGSPYGSAHKRAVSFYTKDREMELMSELMRTWSLSRKLATSTDQYEQLNILFSELRDIRKLIIHVKNGSVLSEIDLFEIKYFINRMHRIDGLKREILGDDCPMERLDAISHLLDPDGSGLGTFHIYDSYDEELKSVRTRKRDLERNIRLASDQEEKTHLLGERRDIVAEEEEAEYRVRKILSAGIMIHADRILENMDTLGEMDFLLAKAKLASEYDTALPEIGDEQPVSMTDGYHPYFQELVRRRTREFVRISLSIDRGSTVITGANMGGKSITLKTLFLNTVLSHLGILPFAEKMTTPLLGHMHLLCEDAENPHKGLSSFGGEVVKIREIMEEMTDAPSLIILDEPARGTNPLEGTAIVGGLLRFFKDKTHFLLVASHYDLKDTDGIKRYQVKGLKDIDLNKHMLGKDEDKHKKISRLSDLMDYTLEKYENSASAGDAVKIGEFLGLPRQLTTEIRKLLE